MSFSIDMIGKELLKHNIKPSFPRVKIFQYLVEKKSHPTVDEIHSILVKEVPTLSKTTVYNTLNLFVEANMAKVITIEDNETRYDADISTHGHFKCEQCGTIYDFHIKMDNLETEGLKSFQIREKDFYYKGTCSKCLEYKN